MEENCYAKMDKSMQGAYDMVGRFAIGASAR